MNSEMGFTCGKKSNVYATKKETKMKLAWLEGREELDLSSGEPTHA
jgi:hypothetical protein